MNKSQFNGWCFSSFQRIDEAELNGIGDFFFKHRNEPLKIGSLMGNFGHTESASALMAILKVIIAMNKGIVPATLHHKQPNNNIPYLKNGQLEVMSSYFL